MSNVSQWDNAAANNNDTPPDGWPEGQAPSTVNDCARELMAAVSRWYDDQKGELVTAGSSNSYTLTTNSSHAALADQSLIVFRADRANTGAATLNVDSLGAKPMQLNGSSLGSGYLVQDVVYAAVYDSTDDAYHMLMSLTPTQINTALGLGTMSTQNSSNVTITGGAISGVTLTSVYATDDETVQGISTKPMSPSNLANTLIRGVVGTSTSTASATFTDLAWNVNSAIISDIPLEIGHYLFELHIIGGCANGTPDLKVQLAQGTDATLVTDIGEFTVVSYSPSSTSITDMDYISDGTLPIGNFVSTQDAGNTDGYRMDVKGEFRVSTAGDLAIQRACVTAGVATYVYNGSWFKITRCDEAYP